MSPERDIYDKSRPLGSAYNPITDIKTVEKFYDTYDYLIDRAQSTANSPSALTYDDIMGSESNLQEYLSDLGCSYENRTYNGVGNLIVSFPFTTIIRRRTENMRLAPSRSVNTVYRIKINFEYLVLEKNLTGNPRIFLRNHIVSPIHISD